MLAAQNAAAYASTAAFTSSLQPSSCSGMIKATLPLAVGWSRCRSRYELGSSLSHADPHGRATCSASSSTTCSHQGMCLLLERSPSCLHACCRCTLLGAVCLLTCSRAACADMVHQLVHDSLVSHVAHVSQERGTRLFSRKIKSGLFPGFHFSRT